MLLSFSMVVSAPFDLNAYLRVSLPPVNVLSGTLTESRTVLARWSDPSLSSPRWHTKCFLACILKKRKMWKASIFCHSWDLGICPARNNQVTSAEMLLMYYCDHSWLGPCLVELGAKEHNAYPCVTAMEAAGWGAYSREVGWGDFFSVVSGIFVSRMNHWYSKWLLVLRQWNCFAVGSGGSSGSGTGKASNRFAWLFWIALRKGIFLF